MPAAFSVASSGPLSAQHPADFPSITTAGIERMPRLFARLATSKQKYEEEKQKVASQVIDILKNHFHG